MHVTHISTTWWIVIGLLALWSLPWKLVALYKAARNGDKWWFVIMFFVNSLAILEICYIYLVDSSSKQK